MRRFPRLGRILARRPRPASLLAAGTAVIILGGLGTVGASDATLNDYAPKSAATAGPDLVAAYNGGWKAGVADLGDGTAPTYPDVVADGNDPGTVAWNDGWVDGQADALGDDNRDGRVDEDESGWDCRTMGNRVCGGGVPPECENAGDAVQLCVTVASRPAYGWTNPDGSQVENPDGRAQVRDLEEKPGTPGFTAALRALDDEYREHAPRH